MAQQVNESMADAVAVSIANKGMATGAVAGFFGWAAQVNWIGLCGVIIALAGLLGNLYFQHRRDKRETAEREERRWRADREHQLRMDALRDRR